MTYIKILKALLLYMSLFGIISCSGGGVNDDSPPPLEVDPPSVSALEFPLQNSECTVGTNFYNNSKYHYIQLG